MEKTRDIIKEIDFFELLGMEYLSIEKKITVINSFTQKVLEEALFKAGKDGLFSRKDREHITLMMENGESSQSVQQYIVKVAPKVQDLIVDITTNNKIEALILQIRTVIKEGKKQQTLTSDSLRTLKNLIEQLESESTSYIHFKARLNSYKQLAKRIMNSNKKPSK